MKSILYKLTAIFFGVVYDITGEINNVAWNLYDLFYQLTKAQQAKDLHDRLVKAENTDSPCPRCAGTKKVGRIVVNKGTLSETKMICDWTIDDDIVDCPDCVS